MSESFLAAISTRGSGTTAPAAAPAPTAAPAPEAATVAYEGKLRERVRTSKRQPSVMIVPQTFNAPFNLEHSVHRPSRLLRNDIELVFRPDLDTEYKRHEAGAATGIEKNDFLLEHLLVVPTWQPAAMDLSEIAGAVNVVRRGLLQSFDRWAGFIRRKLLPYWSDCACPVDG